MTDSAISMNLLDRGDRLWGQLLAGLALLAGALVALMVVVICVDVFVRNLGLGNMPWAPEIAEYTLYLSTFFAAPWLLRTGGHVRMDMLIKTLPRSMGWALELFTDTVGIVACTALAAASANVAIASARQGSLVFKVLVFPEWWVLTPASIMFGVLAVEFCWRFRRQWRGPRTVREEATSVA